MPLQLLHPDGYCTSETTHPPIKPLSDNYAGSRRNPPTTRRIAHHVVLDLQFRMHWWFARGGYGYVVRCV
jgi:hypothetical protein